MATRQAELGDICPICGKDMQCTLMANHHCTDDALKRREAALKRSENRKPQEPTFADRLEIAAIMMRE